MDSLDESIIYMVKHLIDEEEERKKKVMVPSNPSHKLARLVPV